MGECLSPLNGTVTSLRPLPNLLKLLQQLFLVLLVLLLLLVLSVLLLCVPRLGHCACHSIHVVRSVLGGEPMYSILYVH